jgi:scyllo-inositol 2-dehydrogenase (NADP+)
MSLTAGEAQQMIDEAARNAVKLSVFQNRRWDWDFLTVKSVLAQGWLGNPYLLESAVMRFRPPRGWRADATSSGGILFDWGAHLVDQALVLVPSAVVSVSCAIQKRAWGADIGSYARVLLRFSNGVLYAIEVGNLSRYERPRWLVLGDRGSFVKTGLDPQEPAMLRGAIDQAQESAENQAELRVEANGLVVRSRLESVRGDWTDYYRNVADALDGKAELAVKPEECLRAMRVLDAAMDASRLGRSLDVHI